MIRQITVAVLLGTVARADIFTPIDVHKQADLSGKTVAMPIISFDSLPQPTRSQPVSPVTEKKAAPGKLIETKSVDLNTLAPSATVPTKNWPMTNFTPKHGFVDTAVVPSSTVPQSTVPTERARINERVIRPHTPAGSDELKKQFTQPQEK